MCLCLRVGGAACLCLCACVRGGESSHLYRTLLSLCVHVRTRHSMKLQAGDRIIPPASHRAQHANAACERAACLHVHTYTT
jgi:NAD-dependent oxidoreductase involved in siderophore biosynthesis